MWDNLGVDSCQGEGGKVIGEGGASCSGGGGEGAEECEFTLLG